MMNLRGYYFEWGSGDPADTYESPQYHVDPEDEWSFDCAEIAFDEACFWAQRDANRKGMAQQVYGIDAEGEHHILATFPPTPPPGEDAPPG